MGVHRVPLGRPGDVVLRGRCGPGRRRRDLVLEDQHVARDAALSRRLPDDRGGVEAGLRPGVGVVVDHHRDRMWRAASGRTSRPVSGAGTSTASGRASAAGRAWRRSGARRWRRTRRRALFRRWRDERGSRDGRGRRSRSSEPARGDGCDRDADDDCRADRRGQRRATDAARGLRHAMRGRAAIGRWTVQGRSLQHRREPRARPAEDSGSADGTTRASRLRSSGGSRGLGYTRPTSLGPRGDCPPWRRGLGRRPVAQPEQERHQTP